MHSPGGSNIIIECNQKTNSSASSCASQRKSTMECELLQLDALPQIKESKKTNVG